MKNKYLQLLARLTLLLPALVVQLPIALALGMLFGLAEAMRRPSDVLTRLSSRYAAWALRITRSER